MSKLSLLLISLLLLTIQYNVFYTSTMIVEGQGTNVYFLVEAIENYPCSDTSTTSSLTVNACELKYTVDAALEFMNTINSKTSSVSFTFYSDDLARPKHWWIKDIAVNKQDSDLVSFHHYALFVGHGEVTQFYFSQKDQTIWDRTYNYTELQGVVAYGVRRVMIYPTNITRWLTIFACDTLLLTETIFRNVIYYTFNGGKEDAGYLLNTYLHGIVGAATDMYDYTVYKNLLGQTTEVKNSVNTLKAYANYLSEGYSFKEAWFRAVTENQPDDVKPAVVYVSIWAYSSLVGDWVKVYSTENEGMEPFSDPLPPPRYYAKKIANQEYNGLTYYVNWVYEVYEGDFIVIEEKLNPQPSPSPTQSPPWTPPQPILILPLVSVIIHYPSSYKIDRRIKNRSLSLIVIIILGVIGGSLINTEANGIEYYMSREIPIKSSWRADERSRDVLYGYTGKSLTELLGKKLYYIHTSCTTDRERTCYHETMVRGLHERLYYMVSKIIEKAKNESLKIHNHRGLSSTILRSFLGTPGNLFYDQEKDLLILFVKGNGSKLILTSNGYFYYESLDNSSVESLYMLRGEFAKIVWDALEGDFDPIALPFNYTIVYGGVSGTSKKYVYEGPIGSSASPSFKIIYVNPYEKYYIVVNDIRIGHPIKIVVELFENKIHIKRMEGFIPVWEYAGPLERKNAIKEFTLDKQYLDMIVQTYNDVTGLNISDPSKLVIIDIYYTIYDDYKHLVPLLKIKYNKSMPSNYIVYLYLTPSKPVFKMMGVTLGAGSLSISDDSLREYKEFVKLKIEESTYNRNIRSSSFYIENEILLITIFITIMVIAGIISYKRLRKT